jgi:hypothetical protein
MKTLLNQEAGHSPPTHSHAKWWTGVSTLLVALAGLTFAQQPAPKEWDAWAKWAEKRHPVTDAEGHGPDIGSDEWANALAKRLGVIDADGHGPDLKSDEWRAAVEKKLMPKEKRELLSAHETTARFTGLKDHQCMGRTSMCPDRCGDSGKLAVFEIIEYLNYRKPGKYGDPKQERFQILIEDNMKNLKVSPGIRDAILALQPGDSVHLEWNHDYVSKDGSSFPERVIVKLEPLAGEEKEPAAPLVGGYAPAAVDAEDVRKAADFAVRTKQAESAGLALIGIKDARTQIVAGRNFKLLLKVRIDGVDKQAEAVVYQDLGNNISLTSWSWK